MQEQPPALPAVHSGKPDTTHRPQRDQQSLDRSESGHRSVNSAGGTVHSFQPTDHSAG